MKTRLLPNMHWVPSNNKRLLLILLILSACLPIPKQSTQFSLSPTQPVAYAEYSGQVVDENGVPLSEANVRINSTVTQTDNEGWFHQPSNGLTEWVTVLKPGYITRTRAIAPGTPILLRVSPDDGKTIVLKFTGDVMFGRRFFDPNSDGIPDDGLLPKNPSIEDHFVLLKPIQPLLSNSDITAVNLETVLSTQPFFSVKDPRPVDFHPTKDYVYATHPNAIAALMESGVNMFGLGNNHTYDMLDAGMSNTLNLLDDMHASHFGAGMNETQAWAPKIFTIKDKKIAFIGCTTIYVPGGDVAAAPGDITYVASDAQKKGGAAHCEKTKLANTVKAAKASADIVIVMIHGGTEYDRTIPQNPLSLSEVARQAGATLVINHHPHVVSGFSWDGNSLVARSLGNFIFDQTIWPALESYLLTVYIRNNKVQRAFVEPVLLHADVAHGIAGELAGYVARDAAGQQAGPFIMESDTMEIDVQHTATETFKDFSLDGGTGILIHIPDNVWISNFQGNGKLRLGRDLMWVGGFENTMVDYTYGLLPLWVQTDNSSVQVSSNFAYEGEAGIRLSRHTGQKIDAVTTNLYHLLVQPGTQLTIAGMFRSSVGAKPAVQVSWFPSTAGPSKDQTVFPLQSTTADTWQPFSFDVIVPDGIVAAQIFLRLPPPNNGDITADFDNLRVIQWAPDSVSFSPLYDFARLTGNGKLTLSQSVLPGGSKWLTLPNLDISKYILKDPTETIQ